MIKKKYRTLKYKKNNLLSSQQLLLEEEQGYEIFIDNVAFFVYNDNNYGWIVVDQETGISFSQHFKTRSEAIEEMKNKMSSYQDIVQTEEYQKLIRKYKTLINNDDSVINGQMSIYDYE